MAMPAKIQQRRTVAIPKKSFGEYMVLSALRNFQAFRAKYFAHSLVPPMYC